MQRYLRVPIIIDTFDKTKTLYTMNRLVIKKIEADKTDLEQIKNLFEQIESTPISNCNWP